MKRWLFGLFLLALACAAQALPTVAEVQSEVQKGHYAQAQSMMREVVQSKPGSARAHYIYAEILAHNGEFAQATQEVALSRQLDPALSFTTPERFQSFEQLLEREQRHAPSTASSLDGLAPGAALDRPAPRAIAPRELPAGGGGLPGWIVPAGLALLGVFLWSLWRRSRSYSAAGSGALAGSYGATPGYAGATPMGGPSPLQPSGGSGLMGVGLAAAGGVAAGMLAEKLLDHGREPFRRDDDVAQHGAFGGSPVNSDDDARALENRDVDFGSGSDNWDSGSAGGGAIDVGGGGDDGGW